MSISGDRADINQVAQGDFMILSLPKELEGDKGMALFRIHGLMN